MDDEPRSGPPTLPGVPALPLTEVPQLGVLSQAVAHNVEVTTALAAKVDAMATDLGYVASLLAVGSGTEGAGSALPAELLALPSRVEDIGALVNDVRIGLGAIDDLAHRVDRVEALVAALAEHVAADTGPGGTATPLRVALADMFVEQLTALDSRQGVIEDGLRALWGRLDAGEPSTHITDALARLPEQVGDAVTLAVETAATGLGPPSDDVIASLIAALETSLEEVAHAAGQSAADEVRSAADEVSAQTAAAVVEQVVEHVASAIADVVPAPRHDDGASEGGMHPTAVIDGDVLDELVQTTVDTISDAMADRLGLAVAEAAADPIADAVAQAIADAVSGGFEADVPVRATGRSTGGMTPEFLSALAGTLDEFGGRVDNDLDSMSQRLAAIADLLTKLVAGIDEAVGRRREGSSETFTLLRKVAAETRESVGTGRRRSAPAGAAVAGISSGSKDEPAEAD